MLENAQRMFCTNQLGSLSNRQAALRVRHTGDVDVKIEIWPNVLHAAATTGSCGSRR